MQAQGSTNMSETVPDQTQWEIDIEIATAKHIETGATFRYLPVPNQPSQLRTYIISAQGEYANALNQSKQRELMTLAEEGKSLYLSIIRHE